MLSQMLANNNMMMNFASNNNISNNNNSSNISGSGSNCNTPSLSMGGSGTPKQIQFFPSTSSATPSVGGTPGGTLTGGGGGGGANGAPPTTSASPGNPPLKQTAGDGQLPISLSTGGLTI